MNRRRFFIITIFIVISFFCIISCDNSVITSAIETSESDCIESDTEDEVAEYGNMTARIFIPDYKKMSEQCRVIAPQVKWIELSYMEDDSWIFVDRLYIDITKVEPIEGMSTDFPGGIWQGTFKMIPLGTYPAGTLEIKLIEAERNVLIGNMNHHYPASTITSGENTDEVVVTANETAEVVFYTVPEKSNSKTGELYSGEMKFRKIKLERNLSYFLSVEAEGTYPDIVLFNDDGTFKKYYSVDNAEESKVALDSVTTATNYYVGIYADDGDVTSYSVKSEQNIPENIINSESIIVSAEDAAETIKSLSDTGTYTVVVTGEVNYDNLRNIASALSDTSALVNLDLSWSTELESIYNDGFRPGVFSDLTCLKSIKIPEGVTSIGWNSFWGCTGLESITIPSSMAYINDKAFYDCYNIKDVYIKNLDAWNNINFGWTYSNPVIDYGATLHVLDEDGSELETIIFLNSTNAKYILGDDYENKTDIVIPNGVREIGDSVFRGCTNLESIVIPDSVREIGNSVFSGCTSLGSVVIPEGVTSISDSAFYDCTSLESIVIPEGVKAICRSAFYNCTSLNAVHYTGDIEGWCEIDFDQYDDYFQHYDNPLYYAHHLYINDEEVTDIVIPNTVTEIKNFFIGCENLKSVVIPEGVTSIGMYAFYGCTSLESIVIPEGVTSIGMYAFYGCTSLESIVIPEGVTSIGNSAFYGCASLESVTIPEGVTSIGNSAFYGCASLESIVIPEGVTSIGWEAFENCTNLENVTLSATLEAIDSNAFANCYNLKAVYYKGDIESWCKMEFGGSIISYSNPLYYAHHLYINGVEVTDIGIPNSVTEIKNYAFAGCETLKSVVIPEGVTSIGWNAFENCTNFESISLPASLISISRDAFSGCASLENVYYKGSIEDWCKVDFEYEHSSPLSDPNKRTHLYVGGVELSGELIIPDTITQIKNYTFYCCESLESVVIPDSVTSIGNYAFSRCRQLKEITIPESVISIGDYALSWCWSLENVIIPKSVTSIGEKAFYSNELNTVYYNGTLEEWNQITFGDNYSDPRYCAKKFYVSDFGTPDITVTLPDRTDVPKVEYTIDQGKITLTAETGYNTYVWSVDMIKQTETSNVLQIDSSTLQFGLHSVMVIIDGKYSSTITVVRK